MTGILTIRQTSAQARLAAFFTAFMIAAGLACPVLADAAPRVALPSSEAIGWLLETEATGAAAPWTNSRSGYSGTLTITRTRYQADGTPCREYTIAAMAGGPQMTIKKTSIKGTGCRAASGEWSLAEDAPVLVAVVPLSPPTQKPPPTQEPGGPDVLSPSEPAAATALPAQPPAPAVAQTPAPTVAQTLAPIVAQTPAPAVAQTPAPLPAPVGSDVTFTAADFIAATEEHKPVTISANLPSRSDE